MKFAVPACILLAVHWALWPGSLIGSASGAVFWLTAAVLLSRNAALARAAMLAAATMTAFLDASFTHWQPWVAAPIFILTIDATFAKPGKDGPLQGIAFMTLSFIGLSAFLVAWRPTRFGLIAPDATLPAVTFLAALGAGLALYALRAD